jgi:hypothetical protein
VLRRCAQRSPPQPSRNVEIVTFDTVPNRRVGSLIGCGVGRGRVVVGFTETLISQTLSLSKAPFDLLRGTSGEEKILKNAKDAYATEA